MVLAEEIERDDASRTLVTHRDPIGRIVRPLELYDALFTA
jgi:hypothetical protein